MFISIVENLGNWTWLILALILFILEILVPGVFFLWFAVSAFIVGLLSILINSIVDWWNWQYQIALFVTMLIILIIISKKFMQSNWLNINSSSVDLNRRTEQLVDQIVTLEKKIDLGRGHVNIGGTMWLVTGPDLPAYTKVIIVGIDGNTLRVEPYIESVNK